MPAVTSAAGPLDETFSGPFASWKNVKDFGAVGNGVTDDTAARIFSVVYNMSLVPSHSCLELIHMPSPRSLLI
jgi:hypothetical protein